jgi:hypothetical protein
MLCVYQALRHLTADTAHRAGLPVTHISFKNALAAVRRTVGTDFPPRKLAAKLTDVQADLIRTAVKPPPLTCRAPRHQTRRHRIPTSAHRRTRDHSGHLHHQPPALPRRAQTGHPARHRNNPATHAT